MQLYINIELIWPNIISNFVPGGPKCTVGIVRKLMGSLVESTLMYDAGVQYLGVCMQLNRFSCMPSELIFLFCVGALNP